MNYSTDPDNAGFVSGNLTLCFKMPDTSPPEYNSRRIKFRRIAHIALQGLAILVGVLIALRIIGAVGYYRIPTSSMNPTLEAGDHIIADGVSYWFRDPQRGELIVFDTHGIRGIRPPDGQRSVIYMKRLVGMPGDRVVLRDGGVYINGEPLKFAGEPVKAEPFGNGKSEWLVPDEAYFALGDNVANSHDSRYWGFVPAEDVISRIVLRVFPSIGRVE